MKNNNILILALLVFFPFFSWAQAPGYLGKKAVVSFTVSSFPAINGPTQNNKGSNAYGSSAGRFGFNYEFEGGLSYAIGRYRMLSLDLGQYYTGATQDAMTNAWIEDPFSSFVRFDYHELFYRVNVKSVGLRLSKFNARKGALAPVGNRFFYGLKRSFVTTEIVDKKTNFDDKSIGNLLGHRDLEIDQKLGINFFQLGWSNDQVFWDKVVLKTGIRFSFPLNIKLMTYAWEDKFLNPDYYSNPNQADYNTEVFRRIFRHEILRIDFGVGFLLF